MAAKYAGDVEDDDGLASSHSRLSITVGLCVGLVLLQSFFSFAIRSLRSLSLPRHFYVRRLIPCSTYSRGRSFPTRNAFLGLVVCPTRYVHLASVISPLARDSLLGLGILPLLNEAVKIFS